MQVFAENNKTNFHKHSLELGLTPSFDYHFIVAPARDPSISQYYRADYRSLGGFETGVTYIYRPLLYLGFSSGMSILLYGTRMSPNFSNLLWGSQWDPSTGGYNAQVPSHEYFGTESILDGSFAIPVYFHFYIPLKRMSLEFVTGPEFRFLVWSLQNGYTYIDAANNTIDYSNKVRTVWYSASSIRDNSNLCWSLQGGVDVPTKKGTNIFIGAEWKLLNPVYLSHATQNYQQEPKLVNYTLGIKLGIRFSIGKKKMLRPKTDEKSKA